MQRLNTFTAKYIAHFDKIFDFHPNDINDSFRQEHESIFRFKRGNGLWLWKPYFINQIINRINDGDILFYCDAGCFFIREPKYIYDSLSEESPVFVCDIPLIEANWTKKECFDKLGCNEEKYKKTNQIIATFFALYVCPKSKKIIAEWLEKCCDFELLSPVEISEEFGEDKDRFISHREDQSIFSLICKKYSIQPHKDFSQRGDDPYSYYIEGCQFKIPNHPNDNYKPCLFLHKSRTVFSKRFLYRLRRYILNYKQKNNY